MSDNDAVDQSLPQDYDVGFLTEDDLPDVISLYAAVSAGAPAGHLATRSPEAFQVALQDRDGTVAAGARHNGRLIAYSICRRSISIPYDPAPFLSGIDPAHSRVYLGMGTVVHPRHEGRMLMARLMKLRGEGLRRQEADHVLGLVATGNLASIASILRAGAVLVGFSRDETAKNYVGYAGQLFNRVHAGATAITIVCSDEEQQQLAFASGSLITSMRRQTDGLRVFDFVPFDRSKIASLTMPRSTFR